jgi:predicted transcriptional regulator
MTSEIPQYGLKAYALFYNKHKENEEFSQSELDWIVGQSMKKKIFSLLLKSGWIKKKSKNTYICTSPKDIMKGLLELKVQNIIKESKKDYAFTGLSAIEIWSDYSYVQRGIERSPYFIKVLKKDLKYWKNFFNKNNIPNYVEKGSTIGEYVILIPVEKLSFVKKDELFVESLKDTIKIAKLNEMYLYAYNYIKKKYNVTR